jgi:hypothetical protein
LTDQSGLGGRLDRVLAADFLTDLTELPLGGLRDRRAEAIAEEADLSYLRRVLHGRIDIIAAELARRASGDNHPLVTRLKEILADAPPGRVASARHQPIDRPRVGEYRLRIEARLQELALADLGSCSDDALCRAADALHDYEREVSELRRIVQQAVDKCAVELGRRYREGEATVDDLLAT